MRTTQSRYIALCLMKEQKKPVKKWHLISTHKYTHTQSRKGRPSPCFSPFAYFPISHNTNQTAKLTSPPNESAILRLYRRAPWQHQLNEAFGTPSPVLHADPQTAVPPSSEAAPALTARLLKLRMASKHTENRLERYQHVCWLGFTKRITPAQPTYRLDTVQPKSAKSKNYQGL